MAGLSENLKINRSVKSSMAKPAIVNSELEQSSGAFYPFTAITISIDVDNDCKSFWRYIYDDDDDDGVDINQDNDNN